MCGKIYNSTSTQVFLIYTDFSDPKLHPDQNGLHYVPDTGAVYLALGGHK